MAAIGQSLTTPESGWRRYDDIDNRIQYGGSGWTAGSGGTSTYYNNTFHWCKSLNNTIKFKFFGTKLRIISFWGSVFSSNISIQIDGNSIEYYIENGGTDNQYGFKLVYEKTGLLSGIHSVVITNLTANEFDLDAIDIDTTGYLVHPTLNQVSSLLGMQSGDCIPCRYTALSGTIGTFSELGTCIANEIPITGTATPDGLFYFIKTNKGILIADRVIQTSISWDTLNAGELMDGYSDSFLIPIMTSDNTPSGIVTYSSIYGAGYEGWKVFDVGLYSAQQYWNANVANGWIAYEFPNPTLVNGYAYKSIASYPNRSPKNFTFEAWNGTQWIVLDTQTNISASVVLQRYYFVNTIAYTKYRLNISATNGDVISLDTVKFYNNLYLTCSLSGGCSFADTSGNSITTDQSKGAWPINNEWDKYIVNSDLNGKITKGDDSIWHWSNLYSWVKETPIPAIGTNTTRCYRGKDSVVKFGSIVSTTATANYGFRPVLRYVEANSKSTNLFY